MIHLLLSMPIPPVHVQDMLRAGFNCWAELTYKLDHHGYGTHVTTIDWLCQAKHK